MPANDIHHDSVRVALEADGWTITDDPLRLVYGKRAMCVDLGLRVLVFDPELQEIVEWIPSRP